MTRLANVKRFAQVAVMAAALTAVGAGVGSAMAQAAPHFPPHPGVPPTAGHPTPTERNPVLNEFRGIVYFRNGIPIGSILPGQENVGHLIDILVKCRAHEGNSHVNPDGFVFVHCS
jgi:hypothetical protein